MYLLDSDWVIDHLAKRPAAQELLTRLAEGGLAISVVSYAEVFQGIEGGRDPVQSERAFVDFLEAIDVLNLTPDVARRAASIAAHLQKQGTRLPLPDVFIAATAIYHGLTLVTRNQRHYQRIAELAVLDQP